jgi:hypothetical protein
MFLASEDVLFGAGVVVVVIVGVGQALQLAKNVCAVGWQTRKGT